MTNRFDDDTSAQYAPRRQAEWLANADAKLEGLPAGSERAAERDDDRHSGSSLEPL